MPPLTERAFEELYGHALRPLWAYVRRVIGNAADADEVVQEAFCRVLCADISSLSLDEQRRYVFRVASHVVVDRWRRSKRERSWLRHVEPERAVAPEPPADDLVKVFEMLKPRERALLWLAYVEQDSHEEIATALGVRRSSVKVLLARARARLRDLLTARQTRT
ncbi:MAG TPA: RNA polymerase sigma factor [Vicinamibacterales bacterium]|nr:RNA polymerase sigma factor [Vicinamibacterales bacterium]